MKSPKNSEKLGSMSKSQARAFRAIEQAASDTKEYDWRKIFILCCLGLLSWISTYTGMMELIQANSGQIAMVYKFAIGFAVAVLMIMIIYLLDQLFSPLNWMVRTFFVTGYLFLTLISVGFGFGFYWKYLESRSEATRSAESAVSQVQTSLVGGQTRLEQLQTTLAALTALSSQKAIEERNKGTSCPNSRPGDGPRRKLRNSDAASFAFAGTFVSQRVASVKTQIAILNADLKKVTSASASTFDKVTGTRNAFLKGLDRKLNMTSTKFNAFRSDPQLHQFRDQFAKRAATTSFPNGRGGTFSCPDTQLQTALQGVVRAIDELPTLGATKITAVEGSEAIIEAFRRLTTSLTGLATLQMPISEDELRAQRQKVVSSLDDKAKEKQQALNNIQAGLGTRDYIPLGIALFVDFCLFLVSINRPMDRLKTLSGVMHEASNSPVSDILSNFHETHLKSENKEFQIFQHIVFDWWGHYFAAVPLASDDTQAHYLSNFFVGLEGKGIVDRALFPPRFVISRRLNRMGSHFAHHNAYRLYKFRDGAWSKIVLNAVMGSAKRLEQDKAMRELEQAAQPDAPIETSQDERVKEMHDLFDLTANGQKHTGEVSPPLDEHTSLSERLSAKHAVHQALGKPSAKVPPPFKRTKAYISNPYENRCVRDTW